MAVRELAASGVNTVWLYLYITVLISDDLNLNLFKKEYYIKMLFLNLLSFEMHVLSCVLGDGHG